MWCGAECGGKNTIHPKISNTKFIFPHSVSTTGATGTTTAGTRATKKIARKLARTASSTVTMESASRGAFAVTKTMTAAMAVMKKGKQKKVK